MEELEKIRLNPGELISNKKKNDLKVIRDESYDTMDIVVIRNILTSKEISFKNNCKKGSFVETVKQ